MYTTIRTDARHDRAHVPDDTSLPVTPSPLPSTSGNPVPGPLCSDLRPTPSVHERAASNDAMLSESPRAQAERLLRELGFDIGDLAALRATTAGLNARVCTPPRLATQTGLHAMRECIDMFFREPIQSDPHHSELGGEKVLLLSPSRAAQKADSSFLMYFDGEQTPHRHFGPRLLYIFSPYPWHLLIGGTADPAGMDRVPFTKVEFPAGQVTLSMPPRMLHGFSIREGGAFSSHWTDQEEMAELAVTGGDDLMEKLTELVDPARVDIIGGKAVPLHLVKMLHAAS